jgi:hypothetical protein
VWYERKVEASMRRASDRCAQVLLYAIRATIQAQRLTLTTYSRYMSTEAVLSRRILPGAEAEEATGPAGPSSLPAGTT